jgi:hypothetical protein
MFVGIRRVGALLIIIRELYGIVMLSLFFVFLISDMLRVVSLIFESMSSILKAPSVRLSKLIAKYLY